MHPMIYVTWHDATAYAKWRVRGYLVKQSGEYAARGGLVGKRYPWGDSMLTSQANYGSNVGNPVSVGSYSANDYGLYDMSGNVWEWVADWYQKKYYEISPVNNPQGPGTGERRVLRAVLGTSLRAACVWLTATASILLLGTSTTDFAVCQDFRTEGPRSTVFTTGWLICI